MDDSRDFDLDRMMERIRLKVRDSRLPAEAGSAAASGQPGDDQRSERDLAELHRAYDLSRVPLDPGRRVLGWTMLTAAKAVSALLRPIIRRQTEYNAANTRLITVVKKEVDRLRPQVNEIRAVTEHVIVRTAEDLKTQTQALARRFAGTYTADMAMHARALGDLSQRMAALEQLQAGRDALLQRLETLERRQEELRGELDRYESESQSHRMREHEQWLRDQDQRLAAREQQIESIDARYSELAAAVAAAREEYSQATARALSHYQEFTLVRERVVRAERRLRRLLERESGNGAAASQENPQVPPAAAEIDYAGFEDRLRDSRMVKDRQRGYLKYFLGKAPVIDVGCGKGEFLELMREAGIAAKGLDLDLDMVLHCQDKGLDVERRDAIGYLADQPDGSVGGIFSAQVIEHLTSPQLSALITLGWRKLMPGGIVVLETLNPESLFVHYKWFWMDPSHVRLVHPQTLQFLLDSTGFAEISCHLVSPPADVLPIPPLHGGVNGTLDDFNRATDYLNKLIYGEQEYFVVARK